VISLGGCDLSVVKVASSCNCKLQVAVCITLQRVGVWVVTWKHVLPPAASCTLLCCLGEGVGCNRGGFGSCVVYSMSLVLQGWDMVCKKVQC
jgi:hypothetical protein